MAEKRTLLELDIDTDSIVAKSVELKKQLDETRASVQELKKSGDTSSEAFVTQSAQVAKLSQEYNLNQKQLTNLVTAEGNLITATEKANAAMSIEVNTVGEASAQNRELLKIRNEINSKTPQGAAAIQQINEKMDLNNQFIKGNVSELEKQKIGIGGYKDSIKEAVGELGGFNNGVLENNKVNNFAKVGFQQMTAQVDKAKDGINNYRESKKAATEAEETYVKLQKIANESTERATAIGFKYAEGTATQAEVQAANTEATVANTTATQARTVAQTAATVATGAGTVALNILKIAFASTGIGALIILFGSLIAYFTSTQEGIDKITSVTRPLQAIFSSLLGVAQNLGKALVDTFSNPKQAMTDLVNFVEQNLINRFKAFGVILDGIINLDFDKVANGALQGVTGVENLTGKISDAASKTSSFLADAAAKGSEIDRLTKEAEKDQLKFNRAQITTNDLIDQQLLKSKDTSLGFKEREKAAKEIIRLTQELGDQEAGIIEKKIAALKIQQSLNDTDRAGQQEMIDLETELDAAQDRGLDAQKEQIRVIAGARKEAAAAASAAAQKSIDESIKETKAKIDLFIAEQGFRKRSLEEEYTFENELFERRKELLRKEFEAKKLSQTEYNAQNLALANDHGAKLAEIAVQNADDELRIFNENNQSKLDSNLALTESIVLQEVDRLNRLSEVEAAIQTKRFEEGLITAREYQEAIAAIDKEFVDAKKSLEDELIEQDKERKLIDLENARIVQNEGYANAYADKAAALERDYQKELEVARKTGADTLLINQKYAKLRKNLDEDVKTAKLEGELKIIQSLRGFANEKTLIGKALALAEIGFTTAINAGKAFAQAAVYYATPVTIPLGVNATLQGNLIIASGIIQGAKVIAEAAGAKFADGAIDIDGPGDERSDSIPARLSRGESVINARSTADFKPLLQAINSGYGREYLNNNVNRYALPSRTITNAGISIDYDLLASKIGENVKTGVMSGVEKLPQPKLALEYFHKENAGYQDLINGANH